MGIFLKYCTFHQKNRLQLYDKGVGLTFFLSGTASSPLETSGQFKDFVSALENRGFQLKLAFPTKFLISMNHNPTAYKEFLKSGGNPKRTVLILLEPRAVYPAQYSSRIQNLYSHVLSPGSPRFKDSNGDFIPWPYQVSPNPLSPIDEGSSLQSKVLINMKSGLFDYDKWSRRSKFIIMINANKVSSSKSENYGLRRVFAHQISKEFLSVYGELWVSSIPQKIMHRLFVLLFAMKSGHWPRLTHVYGNLHWKFKTAKGPIEDKQVILQSSKFSIVIENDNSYISEKIFDSLINGCIPIYSGLKEGSRIIPSGIYIDLPKSPSELVTLLEKISESDIRGILREMQTYLESEAFAKSWDKTRVFGQLASSIEQHFRKTHE